MLGHNGNNHTGSDAPLVSIAMAVYNGSRFLEQQIQSILELNYKHWELVAIDDASTDGSFDLLERYARTDPRIKIRRNATRKGIVGNFLEALRLSGGDLVCFADQDDVWLANKLDVLVALISECPENMMAYSDLEVCDQSLRRIHASFWKVSGIRPRSGVLREFALLRNIIPGCCMMFRKEVKEILMRMLPESSFIHDHLAFILASFLGRVVFSRERLVKYRQHALNNIGAFYPSVADFDRSSAQLRREIAFLKPVLSADLSSLEKFLQPGGQRNFFIRLTFIRFYLWLRKDTFMAKCLGFLECVAPGLYRQCRRGFHAPRSV